MVTILITLLKICKQVKGKQCAGNGRISYYYGDSGKKAISTWIEIQPGIYVYLIRLVLLTHLAKLIDWKGELGSFIFSEKKFFWKYLQVAYMTDF